MIAAAKTHSVTVRSIVRDVFCEFLPVNTTVLYRYVVHTTVLQVHVYGQSHMFVKNTVSEWSTTCVHEDNASSCVYKQY